MGLDYGKTIKRDDTLPNEKGMKTRFLLAPLSWFVSIADFDAYVNPGDHVTISGDHTFDQTLGEEKGFIEGYSWLDTGQLTAELVGDPGGKGFAPKFEGHIPGDDKVLAEIMAFAKDDRWIVLVETANGKYIQLGREKMPAEVNPSFDSGTASGGRNGWLVSVQAYTGRLAYYEGAITLKP